jgi:exodeoxyribonuclease-3
MAHTPKDVSNSSVNQHESGFLPHERQWLSQLFNQIGYVDAFRKVNKDSDEYSWWPSGERDQGDGWRTDLQVVSANLGHKVEYAAIYKVQQFSSHLPVIIDYDIEL